jgi:hypothetical protein
VRTGEEHGLQELDMLADLFSSIQVDLLLSFIIVSYTRGEEEAEVDLQI